MRQSDKKTFSNFDANEWRRSKIERKTILNSFSWKSFFFRRLEQTMKSLWCEDQLDAIREFFNCWSTELFHSFEEKRTSNDRTFWRKHRNFQGFCSSIVSFRFFFSSMIQIRYQKSMLILSQFWMSFDWRRGKCPKEIFSSFSSLKKKSNVVVSILSRKRKRQIYFECTWETNILYVRKQRREKEKKFDFYCSNSTLFAQGMSQTTWRRNSLTNSFFRFFFFVVAELFVFLHSSSLPAGVAVEEEKGWE